MGRSFPGAGNVNSTADSGRTPEIGCPLVALPVACEGHSKPCLVHGGACFPPCPPHLAGASGLIDSSSDNVGCKDRPAVTSCGRGPSF